MEGNAGRENIQHARIDSSKWYAERPAKKRNVKKGDKSNIFLGSIPGVRTSVE
jgi:hypothetical protein